MNEIKLTFNDREIYIENKWKFHLRQIKKFYDDERIVVVSEQYKS